MKKHKIQNSRLLKEKLQSNLDVKEAKLEHINAIKKLKEKIKLSKIKDKQILAELKRETMKVANEALHNQRQKDKELIEHKEQLKKDLQNFKKSKTQRKGQSKLLANEVKLKKNSFLLKMKKEQLQKETLLNQQISELKKEKENLKVNKYKDLELLDKEINEFQIANKREAIKKKTKIFELESQIRLQKQKIMLMEASKKQKIANSKKEELLLSKKEKSENQFELNNLLHKYKEKELEIEKEKLFEQEKNTKELKEAIKISKNIDIELGGIQNFKQNKQKRFSQFNKWKVAKAYGSYGEYNMTNIYIPNKINKVFEKLNIKRSIDVFAKRKETYEKLKLFNYLVNEETPINSKELIKNVLVLKNKKINESLVDNIYKTQIKALLAGYSLKFGELYLRINYKAKDKVIFTNESIFKNFYLFEGELQKQYSKLIEEKLNFGSIIEIYNGLIILKRDDELIILESTNFKGL